MPISLRRIDRRLVVEVVVALALACAMTLSAHAAIGSEFRVVYSLDQRKNDQEIVRLIDDAHSYVYFAIYYFNKWDIAQALIRAKQRGVHVWGIMDAVASTDSNKHIFEALESARVPIEVQKHQDGIMHMKVLVTENRYASGSYNWTDAATNANDEILEISSNAQVHDQYLAIIKRLLIKNQ